MSEDRLLSALNERESVKKIEIKKIREEFNKLRDQRKEKSEENKRNQKKFYLNKKQK